MGANAQTSVPTFTAGEVLTAANMNISARTGIPVFADTTARDAAFGGTGEKTLAEGQFAYLEDTNATQFYDGAAWQAVGVAPGLVLISTTTIGTTVSSVTVSGAFSATYDNYLIIVNGGLASTNLNLQLTLGASNTGYYWGYAGASYAGVSSVSGGANQTYFFAGSGRAGGLNMITNVLNPFLADESVFSSEISGIDTSGSTLRIGGFLNNTTSHTAFTLTTSTGTITGGTIRVYGYANS
jgi:hypothetical protein